MKRERKIDILERAAIAALPECISTCKDVLMRGGSLECNSIPEQSAKMAVEYSEALLNALMSAEKRYNV